MQSSRYTGLPMDRREADADMVVCCIAGDVVPHGVDEVPCLTAVVVEGLGSREEVEALVAVVCGGVVIAAVDDVPEAVVVTMGVCTVKSCRWISDTSR
jgi:hypothetical protein